jgi:hypothetical protein
MVVVVVGAAVVAAAVVAAADELPAIITADDFNGKTNYSNKFFHLVIVLIYLFLTLIYCI